MDKNKLRITIKVGSLILVLVLWGCLTSTNKNEPPLADIGTKTNQTLDSLQGVGPVVLFKNRLWIGNRTQKKQGLYVYDVSKDSVLSYANIGKLPPTSMGVSEDRYLVIANSDFTDGSISLVDLNTGTVEKDYKTIDPDNSISISNQKSFLIERGKNVISGFNNGKLTTRNVFLNVNTGKGSNPHNVGWISNTKAYITRYGSTSLLLVDPSKLDGGVKDSIDLSRYVGGYGMDSANSVPNMSSITVYENHAFCGFATSKRI